MTRRCRTNALQYSALRLHGAPDEAMAVLSTRPMNRKPLGVGTSVTVPP